MTCHAFSLLVGPQRFFDCPLTDIEEAVFARLRAVVDNLADLLRLPFSSALCTTLSRLVINVYKSLTAGTKLHVGTKGMPL